ALRSARTGTGDRAAPGATVSVRGTYTFPHVPTPSSLYTHTNPSLRFTIPYTVASPRPGRACSLLVVKYGSNRCALVAASMPEPVSLTASNTYCPDGISRWSVV